MYHYTTFILYCLYMLLVIWMRIAKAFPTRMTIKGTTCRLSSWRMAAGRADGIVVPPPYIEHHDERFLRPVEWTVHRVLQKYGTDSDILDIVPATEREAVGVARHLNDRLQAFRRDNIHCPRCWLQRARCICADCPPIAMNVTKDDGNDNDDDDDDSSSSLLLLSPDKGGIILRRIFLLMHHKEITMTVDTAKMIMAAFPDTARLVVGGIGPDMQDSMKEMLEALQQPDCLVLFPSDEARTIQDLLVSPMNTTTCNTSPTSESGEENIFGRNCLFSKNIDLVVIDGTWEQARRLYKRYIRPKADGGPQTVCLTEQALDELQKSIQARDPDSTAFTGRQLRRHPEMWREISTLAATRLLLRDMDVALGKSPQRAWDILAEYQERADAAARQQLGTIRMQKS